jgi:hypothetical protein
MTRAPGESAVIESLRGARRRRASQQQTQRLARRRAVSHALGWATGLEPATFGATVRRSNHLSYAHRELLGTPGGIRTPDLEIRSLPLYPAELRAQMASSRRRASTHGTNDTLGCQWSGRRDSNPQQPAWKAGALPIELRPRSGRAGGIRTHDPLLPKQMRYQTALRPDLARMTSKACHRSVQQYRQVA